MRPDLKYMFPVKKPSNEKIASLAQFPTRDNPEQYGQDCHTGSTLGPEIRSYPFTISKITPDSLYEGVPVRIMLKIGENLPAPFRDCMDFNLAVELCSTTGFPVLGRMRYSLHHC